MAMPRSKENQGLPLRWQKTHGAYYYRVPAGLEALWDNKKRFRVYSLFEEGEPFVVHRVQTDQDSRMSNHMHATTADFYTSMREARKLAKHFNDDEWQVSARKLSPSELLSCIARVDIAVIDDIDFAVTRRGKYAIESEKVCSASEILKALAG